MTDNAHSVWNEIAIPSPRSQEEIERETLMLLTLQIAESNGYPQWDIDPQGVFEDILEKTEFFKELTVEQGTALVAKIQKENK